jgi:TRAP-type C4-dicarboxylate transport system substrate-binding protein
MTLTRRAMLAAAGATTAFPLVPREARAATLRYAHVGAPGDVQTRFADELAALARQKSNGRTDIRVFATASLAASRRWSTACRPARSRWRITTSRR